MMLYDHDSGEWNTRVEGVGLTTPGNGDGSIGSEQHFISESKTK
jgi:hypothetical protein